MIRVRSIFDTTSSMKHVFICSAILALLSLTIPAEAQFHAASNGQKGVRQMNQTYNATTMGISNRGVRTGGGSKINGVIVSDYAKDQASKVGAKVGVNWAGMPIKEAEFWGRSIDHPDGSFTETIRDDDPENKTANNLVIQKTKSKNGTLLLKRSIMLNQMGNPAEVMIHDGAGRYKYRGVFVYDNMGRISDELLYDAKGNPLRRTVQEYDLQGIPKPLKTLDYSPNIPKDLQLVVGEDDPEIQKQIRELERMAREQEKRPGLFNRKNRSQAGQPSPPVQAQPAAVSTPVVQPPADVPAPKKRGFFGRFKK